VQSDLLQVLSVSWTKTNYGRTEKYAISHSHQLGSKEISRTFKFFALTDGEIQFYCYTSSPNELVQRHTVDNLFPKEKVSDE